MSCVKGLLPKHSFRQNTISLTAPLRFLPTIGSNFTQFANSSRFKAGLRQYKLSFGTFILAEWVTQKCSKSRFAKSSSGPFDWGLTKIVWATSREDVTLWLLGSAGTVSY
jgi:hypothetical protein